VGLMGLFGFGGEAQSRGIVAPQKQQWIAAVCLHTSNLRAEISQRKGCGAGPQIWRT